MILFLFREEVATASSTGQRWKCTHRGCEKSYSSRKNLNQHVKHLGKKYQCQFCEVVLVSSHGIKRHSISIHGQNIDSVQSSEVVVTKRSVNIAPEAKNAFIHDQIRTIQVLQMKLSKLRGQRHTWFVWLLKNKHNFF